MNNKENFLIKNTSVFLIILNFILKAPYIAFNSIAGDEPFSIYHAQMDISSIIYHLSSGNNPPFYEMILHFWINIFGISEFSVRFPSLVFSVFTVYFIYRIGKEFFSYLIGFIASLLFTFSNYHIFFSHEARVYALFALLTSMSMFYFLKICNNNKQNKKKYYLLLLVINTILIYSHYFGFFVLFIQTFSVVFFQPFRFKLFKKYIIYFLFLIILYSPFLKIVFIRFWDSSIHGTWVGIPNGIESIYNMLWKFSNKPLTTVLSIIVLIAALGKLIIKKNIKLDSRPDKIILLWFLFPFLFMFLISYWIPMFLDRYLIFVSIGYYLVLAICSDYIIDQAKNKFIISGILIAFFIVTTNPNVDNKRNVKETIAKLKEIKGKNTKVLICPQHFVLNFAYYYDTKIFRDVDNEKGYNKMLENLKKENIFPVNNFDEVRISNQDEKIIYLDAAAQFSFPGNNIIPYLNKSYDLKNSYSFKDICVVYEFAKI